MTKIRIPRQGKGSNARGERLECSRPADTAGSSLPLLLFPFYFLGYIGAATGSLIIQVAIATSLGALFVLKAYWRRITGLFKRGKEHGDKEHEEVQ